MFDLEANTLIRTNAKYFHVVTWTVSLYKSSMNSSLSSYLDLWILQSSESDSVTFLIWSNIPLKTVYQYFPGSTSFNMRSEPCLSNRPVLQHRPQRVHSQSDNLCVMAHPGQSWCPYIHIHVYMNFGNVQWNFQWAGAGYVWKRKVWASPTVMMRPPHVRHINFTIDFSSSIKWTHHSWACLVSVPYKCPEGVFHTNGH